MIDSINNTQKTFTTIQYETNDGEKISATKKDGIVTLVGDKNGTRQIPLKEFITNELQNNLKNINLENTPNTDTITLTNNQKIKETKPTEIKDETQPTKNTSKLDTIA